MAETRPRHCCGFPFIDHLGGAPLLRCEEVGSDVGWGRCVGAETFDGQGQSKTANEYRITDRCICVVPPWVWRAAIEREVYLNTAFGWILAPQVGFEPTILPRKD